MNILQQIQQESIKRELVNRLNFEKAEQNSLISQVQDDVLKGMSEEEILEKNRNGGYNDIIKGKSFPIGTIHNGFKKIAEGKWRKVSEHGMTKEEHQIKSIRNNANRLGDEHSQIVSKLDSKDYSDEEVGLKKEVEKVPLKIWNMRDIDSHFSYSNRDLLRQIWGRRYESVEVTANNGKVYIATVGQKDQSVGMPDDFISFKLKKSQADDLEKARSGKYADTPENRKLGRVGQQYGSKKESSLDHLLSLPIGTRISVGDYTTNGGFKKETSNVWVGGSGSMEAILDTFQLKKYIDKFSNFKIMKPQSNGKEQAEKEEGDNWKEKGIPIKGNSDHGPSGDFSYYFDNLVEKMKNATFKVTNIEERQNKGHKYINVTADMNHSQGEGSLAIYYNTDKQKEAIYDLLKK